ncbi:MAG: hypothetical protein RL326_1275 [Pseudomonadota bacterium]
MLPGRCPGQEFRFELQPQVGSSAVRMYGARRTCVDKSSFFLVLSPGRCFRDMAHSPAKSGIK